MKKQINLIIIGILLSINLAFAASISLSLGSYSSEIYTQETVSIPVIVTATNVTGNIDVTLSSKSGLSCSTCTLSSSFTGATSEQKTVTFTLSGTQAGDYNPPFTSISATSGATSATPLTSGNRVTVIEKPTWVKDFSASDTTPAANDEITLTLEITPSGTFRGVVADLILTGGLSKVSGTDPRIIGTITGTSSYQWVVSAASTGTASVELSASDPYETASDNTESVTITVGGGSSSSSSSGGGSTSSSSSSGGSSGSGNTAATYTITSAQLNTGYTKEINKLDKINFPIQGNIKTITLDSVTATGTTITVSGYLPITLSIGEEKKYELTGDTNFDLSVILNKVNATTNKAEFTLKAISQEMTKEEIKQAEQEKAPVVENTDKNKENNTLMWIIIILGIAIVIVLAVIVRFVKFKKKNKKGQSEF